MSTSMGAKCTDSRTSRTARAEVGCDGDDALTAQLAQRQLEQERLIRRFQLTRSEEAAGQDATGPPSRRRLLAHLPAWSD
jgi:hypothetical protein